ncbi:MAG: amidohydrolase [Actinomycetota bacterium]
MPSAPAGDAPDLVPPEDAADLILVGGAVHTVDPLLPRAESIALSRGRIVAVGAAGDVLGFFRGAGTTVVDVGGRTVLPGFQDAHIHAPIGGAQTRQCDLHVASDRAGYLEVIAAYAASHPDVAWIRGGGWAMDRFPGGTPRKEDLDAIVADRPVFLPNRDGHGAWVNSRALELAGVTATTPDPADGRIERDPDGSPSGTLHEGAMHLVDRLIPALTPQEWEEGLLHGQAYLHALGITGWQDAIVGGTYDSLDTYIRLTEQGRLTARVVAALWWERSRGAEQIADLVERRDRARASGFDASSVKIMQDGVLENFTAAVLDPYLDATGRPTDNRGISFVDPALLAEVVPELDRLGFQVHFHALAERAVRESLDAIAAARRANGMNDLRHHIAHIQIVHPEDIPRFRAVGAVANMQPLWATYEEQMTELTMPFIGEERSGWQYPFASLLRAEVPLAAGSDWPVTSADPLWEIAVAVHRRHPRSRGGRGRAAEETFLPDERLTLDQAIEAFTLGSAYVNHLDDRVGSLAVGKEADLVIVDRDLATQDLEGLGEARVECTIVAGRVVHAVGPFAGLT